MIDKQDIPECWLCEGTGLDGWSGEECAHCNGTGEHPAYKAMRERAEQAEAERDRLAVLALSATPERMGGTPDLFCPDGYSGSDPWGVWEQDVFAAAPDPQEGQG